MILNKGKLKTLAIFLLISLFPLVLLGQNSEEEKLRIKFSKSLDKKFNQYGIMYNYEAAPVKSQPI